MSDELLVPGARDVRATLDSAGDDATACVVACPPHPQHGGNRSDRRLVAVGEVLTHHGIDCLRIDYGDWDEGYGEREDVRNALRWAADRYETVGLFGYSFGGCQALLAASTVDVPVAAVSVLAPAPRLAADLDAVAALDDIDCPVQVCYGERDDLVDWQQVVDRADELGHETVAYGADHHFVGQHEKIAKTVGSFLVPPLAR
ncbi:dienelactone hydrolase family protein [Haloarchaeobius sp. HME9146]|uniref:dienelactone hydrolase family protein n=1 Tax=Haloarchaeobius sp. HME9146 TaxID=2978732 RepID=UPI0021C1F261|nr:dienelactone hydrolase family protein [Haloarchaeobius sp. HME9146]MCT9097730.1 dienelactone hydrolase family protein [Haloarchaeobius sp. HME9146]